MSLQDLIRSTREWVRVLFGRYLGRLLSPFFRWWWAAITGVFTILGAFAAPVTGIIIGPVGVAGIVFVVFTLFFLVVSVISVSWPWFAKISSHPAVVDIIPEKTGGTPLTFVIREDAEAIPPGSLLAVYYLNKFGVEVCAAVLETKSSRTDGKGLQAEPKWITSLHKTAFQKGQVRKEDIRLRVVEAEALELVEKCIRGN